MSFTTIEVDDIVAVTDKAILIRQGHKQGEGEVWIAKSLIDGGGDEFERGDQDVEMEVASWFVKQEKLD